MQKDNWKQIIALHCRALRDVERYVPNRILCMVILDFVEAVSPLFDGVVFRPIYQ